MKKSISTILFILFARCLVAQDVLSSEITFTIKNARINVNGSLELEKVIMQFNPNDLNNSLIKGSVNVKTIDTGIGLRDKHLKKEDYFDVEKYPFIELTSKSFSKVGPDQFEGLFNLTIKVTTKELTIPFYIVKEESTVTYKSDFEINRLDFGVGSNSWVMGDEVKVRIELVVQ
ncbi:YceI family protein [Fulvivirga lutea]|uniref:YceI family protein n=1 Tax=Fulvivirga lutea TaxID=2810512 RepID=A0A975A295_9BACT|nr:YceI family protein [Fulvivirga lutea]QSE99249.1 YceI family protein [Fulvivirga lutea]